MKKSNHRYVSNRKFVKNRIEKIEDFRKRKKNGNVSNLQEKTKVVEKKKYKIWHNNSLNFLFRSGFWTEHTPFNHEVSLAVPENFSITSNFDVVIRFFQTLLQNGLNKNVSKINIDHTKCINLGMSASSIMDEIVSLILGYREFVKKPIHLHGEMSKSSSVTDMLIISGLIKRVNAETNATISSEVIPLPLQKNKTADVATTKVIKFLNECLFRHAKRLKIEAQQNIGNMLSEILDNCEIHCGDIKNRNIIGHYRYIPEIDCGECNISIYNLGKTISQTFEYLPQDCELIKEFNNLSKKHSGLFKKKWNKETLWTLYALQENVSSIYYENSRDEARDPGHGGGTITFLTLFSDFKTDHEGYKSKMCISSGHSQIIVDGKYSLGYNDKGYQVIAFNDTNDLEKQPDDEYVYSNETFFPGTIISLKFYIDKDNIMPLVEDN